MHRFDTCGTAGLFRGGYEAENRPGGHTSFFPTVFRRRCGPSAHKIECNGGRLRGCSRHASDAPREPLCLGCFDLFGLSLRRTALCPAPPPPAPARAPSAPLLLCPRLETLCLALGVRLRDRRALSLSLSLSLSLLLLHLPASASSSAGGAAPLATKSNALILTTATAPPENAITSLSASASLVWHEDWRNQGPSLERHKHFSETHSWRGTGKSV